MTGITTPGQSTLPTPNSTKSFWHSDPSKLLLGHRTTASLPSKADLVIIGSGITGASAAHHIRSDEAGKNLNVVMLEAREACWGATGRNGGHCQPLLYDAPPDIGAFELRNYHALKSLIETHHIPCDWRSLTGCHAFMAANMFAVRLKMVQELQKRCPELAQYIKIITKDSQNPSLADLRVPNAAGAFIQTHAASLWPYKLVAWVIERLLAQNTDPEKPTFNLQTNTPATHIQYAASSPSSPNSAGPWIIHTPRGLISTPRLLLATNAYTSHLLPSFSDLIVPVRGEMSALLPPPSMRPSSTKNAPLNHSYVFVGNGRQNIEQDDYLVQRPFASTSPAASSILESALPKGGELMFGGGRAYASQAGVGVSDDSSIDEPAAAYLRQELNVVLDLRNEERELEASHEWSGIMGYSRDGRPWVGEVTEEVAAMGGGDIKRGVSGKGLYVCAGYTGHGMPNGWLAGKAVGGFLLGKKREEVDIPESYLLSKERAERARALDEVRVADAKGLKAGFVEKVNA